MKSATYILTLSLFCILLSCHKEELNNGHIQVKVISHGHAAAQSTVYLKSGIDTIPPSINDSFYRTAMANGDGLIYFSNLPSGAYTLFAKGYCPSHQKITTGQTTITIIDRPRINSYNATIEIE